MSFNQSTLKFQWFPPNEEETRAEAEYTKEKRKSSARSETGGQVSYRRGTSGHLYRDYLW